MVVAMLIDLTMGLPMMMTMVVGAGGGNVHGSQKPGWSSTKPALEPIRTRATCPALAHFIRWQPWC